MTKNGTAGAYATAPRALAKATIEDAIAAGIFPPLSQALYAEADNDLELWLHRSTLNQERS